MTAKQVYPDVFGEWPGDGSETSYPEIPSDERLFDRQRVSDIVTGTINRKPRPFDFIIRQPSYIDDREGFARRAAHYRHARTPADGGVLEDAGGEMMQDAANRFGAEMETWDYEEMIEEYHDHGIGKAILLGWDAETNTGNPPVPNDYVADVRDEHPDFFIGFGSVDPLKDDCVEEAIRCVEDLGLSGFKFQQIAQGFDPSDDEHTELFDTIEDLRCPSSSTAATRHSVRVRRAGAD